MTSPTARRALLLDRTQAALLRTHDRGVLGEGGAAIRRVNPDTVDVLFADGHLVRIQALAICSRCKFNPAIGPQVGAKVERPICRPCHGADLSGQLERALNS